VLVWRDVRGREEPPPVAQLPRPPVLVGPVCDGEDIAPPEFELALLLWCEVVERLHEELVRHHLFELDVLRPRHGGRVVIRRARLGS